MSANTVTHIPQWTFGERLRKARRDHKRWSQRAFAEALGVTEAAYAQWESDNNRPRDIVAVAQRVQDITGVSANWLLGLTDDPRPGTALPQMDSNHQHFDYRFGGDSPSFMPAALEEWSPLPVLALAS